MFAWPTPHLSLLQWSLPWPLHLNCDPPPQSHIPNLLCLCPEHGLCSNTDTSAHLVDSIVCLFLLGWKLHKATDLCFMSTSSCNIARAQGTLLNEWMHYCPKDYMGKHTVLGRWTVRWPMEQATTLLINSHCSDLQPCRKRRKTQWLCVVTVLDGSQWIEVGRWVDISNMSAVWAWCGRLWKVTGKKLLGRRPRKEERQVNAVR